MGEVQNNETRCLFLLDGEDRSIISNNLYVKLFLSKEFFLCRLKVNKSCNTFVAMTVMILGSGFEFLYLDWFYWRLGLILDLFIGLDLSHNPCFASSNLEVVAEGLKPVLHCAICGLSSLFGS